MESLQMFFLSCHVIGIDVFFLFVAKKTKTSQTFSHLKTAIQQGLLLFLVFLRILSTVQHIMTPDSLLKRRNFVLTQWADTSR